MKKALVLGVVVIGLLAVTNPGMEAFRTFVRTHAADRIERELSHGALSGLIGGAGSELLADNISQFTERRSYLVGSTYAVDLDQDGTPNGRVLGVAGQFFVVDELRIKE